MRHNVGHDMQRILNWTVEAEDAKFNEVYAAYARPIIALVFGCTSIEGYTNFVGQQLFGEDWLIFLKGRAKGQKGKPGIKDKIKKIYSILDSEPNFQSGLLQDILTLFERRGYLLHPSLDERSHTGSAPPADVLEMIGDEFSPKRVQKMAQDFKAMILKDSEVSDLTWSLAYWGPPE